MNTEDDPFGDEARYRAALQAMLHNPALAANAIGASKGDEVDPLGVLAEPPRISTWWRKYRVVDGLFNDRVECWVIWFPVWMVIGIGESFRKDRQERMKAAREIVERHASGKSEELI